MTEETYETTVQTRKGDKDYKMVNKTTTAWIQDEPEGIRKEVNQNNMQSCLTYIIKSSLDSKNIMEVMVLVPLERRNETLVYLFSKFDFCTVH